ncbi:hypothetical protein NDU88_005919 [Pleurodeles waltl]|uniref:Uncharacterized protein n=1 Tax=Pleurodeles waltl TaxID=8319 RepID=A0AAV7TVM1_PLEWA|nr:hypothetical protein NDU88_005919 [Pleurodeles waltl]
MQEGVGGSRDDKLDMSQLKNPCDIMSQKYPVDLMNNRRADMALTQLETVQQKSPGSDGPSLAEDLVNQGNVGPVNDGKMEALRLATSRDKEVVQSDTFFSLAYHSSWSSNEQSDFEADKNSPEPDSEISSLASDKELLESGKSATVRKKQRKRSEHSGSVKHLPKPQDTKGLQWDYSKGDLTLYDNTEKQHNYYQSIMEHREESKIESHRTQLACHKMQTQIRWVAKTCSEFTACMEEAETQISHLEDDIGSQRATRETMEKQLEDTQWKLTDLEDRLRSNNLRVLGIPEGVEGSDPQGFMVALFKEAFPDLHQWEWEGEIQRAQRFPFSRAAAADYQSHKFQYYEYGETTGKVLARRIRLKSAKKSIPDIIDANGQKHEKLEEIIEVFKDFYQ